MKYSPFILIAFLMIAIACKSVNNTDLKRISKSDAFSLLEATSQNWTAGIPSGGSGTEYYFTVKINTADRVTFDSAWIHDKAFGLFISKNVTSVSQEPVQFSKGDTITLRVTDLVNQNVTTVNSKPPFSFEGAALISYKVKDKQFYYLIKEITRLPPLNRQ
jgi:hypothetical protein